MGPRNGKKSVAVVASLVAAGSLTLASCANGGAKATALTAAESPVRTSTPIQHVVVLFDENISFDHYFGTYPKAANTDGTKFTAKRHTPRVNGLSKKLLTHNPNQYDPVRLTHEQALTCDQDHTYGKEQLAVDGGRMDKFVENTEKDTCTGQPVLFGEPGLVMDYYDGNTVTGLWNYAQNYAMSDNNWDTVFGPSSPGCDQPRLGQHPRHLRRRPGHARQGQRLLRRAVAGRERRRHDDQRPGPGVRRLLRQQPHVQEQPRRDDRPQHRRPAEPAGRSPGAGSRAASARPARRNGYAVCGATHPNVGGIPAVDYSPHHEPFQYYRSTANEKHLPPSSVAAIGRTDQANHQYDLTDFDKALTAGSMPAVSFLKAPEYQDGHAGYSDPLDEQQFLVSTINKIQRSPEWRSTAIFIAYDDSDGWYDHVPPKVTNGSSDAAQDTPLCRSVHAAGGYQDRCGPSQRLPLLAISPYSKVNHVDHAYAEQTSVLRFIEDNWRVGRIGDASLDTRAGGVGGLLDFWHPRAGRLTLDPKTGAPAS